MDKSREGKIAAALSLEVMNIKSGTWHVLPWGQLVKNGELLEELKSPEGQALIRQRVRERCRQRGCQLFYVYDKVVDEIEGWFHQILLKETDGSYERRPPRQYSEAEAWEEALLFLGEKHAQKANHKRNDRE